MSVKQHLMTAEELWEMPDVSGNGFELVDGEVVEGSPANARHGLIVGKVYKRLEHHAEQHDLGLVFPYNVGYVLRRNPDLVRAPDVSFLARNSTPEGDELDRFVEGPPTLAVEVVSPHDRSEETHRRVRDYLESGTRQVWVLWPKRSAVSVYSPNADTRELGPESQLDGGYVLPGFSVQVGDLFNIR